MPADFSTPDKYSADKAFTQVIFAYDAPLMETELNEMQKILKEQVNSLVKSVLSDGFINKPALTLVGSSLTLPADTIVINGQIFTLTENMTISVAANETVYLAVSEAVIKYTDTIKKGGNLSGGTNVTNDLLDTRVNEETTRRIQRQVQLVKSNTDTSKRYLPIAKVNADGTAVTDNRPFAKMNIKEFGEVNLGNVNADGSIRVKGTFPIISKVPGKQSFVIHRSENDGSLVFAPSLTADGEVWDWSKAFTFKPDGKFSFGGITDLKAYIDAEVAKAKTYQ